MRRGFGMADSGTFVAPLEGECIVLEPFDLALARLQAELRGYLPADVGLVNELIAERRADATLE